MISVRNFNFVYKVVSFNILTFCFASLISSRILHCGASHVLETRIHITFGISFLLEGKTDSHSSPTNPGYRDGWSV